MDKSNVINLIDVTYAVDSFGQQIPQETERQVFCDIASVSGSEWFEAGRAGIKPEYKATMFAFDYNGEETAVFDGVRYSIYRTYLGKNESIELYLERKVGV